MKGKTEARQIRQRKVSKPMHGMKDRSVGSLKHDFRHWLWENAKDVQKVRSNQNQQLFPSCQLQKTI